MSIKEYIVVVSGEAFRVYSNSKINAIKTLMNVCKKYSNTSNNQYKEYWLKIYRYINKKSYTILENEDFCGVRKIF